jgi:hypothetical protein
MDWFGDNKFDRIIVYNRRRTPLVTMREYKYTLERAKKIIKMMDELYRQGYADPDLTMGKLWGVYPEYRNEDPTLTQEQEWPYK